MEAAFFRTFNSIAEPLARIGLGAPAVCGPGLVVLETRGRTSGRIRNVPLIASVLGNFALVSTVRSRRSQWVKNLAANPQARYWMRGVRREATALVFAPWEPAPDIRELPEWLQLAVRTLLPFARDANVAFAILAPPN